MAPPRTRYRSASDESSTGRSATYRPGYCNIGRTEQRQRYRYAAVGALAAVGYVAAVVLTRLPSLLVVGVFAPLALAFEFLVQARTQFCVRFALLGRYDFSGSGGDAGDVTDPEQRRADAVSAAKVTFVAVLAAGVTTGALYALLGAF